MKTDKDSIIELMEYGYEYKRNWRKIFILCRFTWSNTSIKNSQKYKKNVILLWKGGN